MAAERYNIDMSKGPLLGKLIRYAIPLAITYLLQLAFHAADMVVIGRWGTPESLAAIGATIPLGGLLINVFCAISTGSNVLAAQYYGARDARSMTKLVHTSIAMSIIGGVALAILGICFMHFLVRITQIPEASRTQSEIYLFICFLGMPFQIVYNFGCAILRAVGNTRSPLYFLIAAGGINVLLNIFLVVFCHLDVAGVAIATVVSQAISAGLVIRCLQHSHRSTRLIMRHLRVDTLSMRNILRIGMPAGLQAGCFSFSNIIVQSGINSFGVAAVAGVTAGFNIEMLLYSLLFAMHHTIIAAVGQNYGAGKPKRLQSCIKLCMTIAIMLAVTGGSLMSYFAAPLISIFNTDPSVIQFGVLRSYAIFPFYFVLALMDISSGALRGLGHSLQPAIAALVGTCLFRIVWVKFIFPQYGSLQSLMAVYPASWGVVALFNMIILWWFCHQIMQGKQKYQPQNKGF